MINAIELANFKCFQKQRITFRPLTLLTGVNNSGKSTVIQALLLLQQNLTFSGDGSSFGNLKRKEYQKIVLSGELVNLGLLEEVLYNKADDDTFTITIERNEATISIKAVADGNELSAVCDSPVFPNLSSFQYLCADRLCPQTFYPMPTAGKIPLNAIGNKGEFAAYYLYTFGQTKILHADLKGPNLLVSNAAGDSTTLQMQIEAWLSKLGTPVRIQTERPSGTDGVVLRFSFPDISSSYYRPTNVGLGLTYALPIFVASLCSKSGSLLIVENPEAHLHPKGQALMGHFLSRVAACGIQVIVETHSDHVLNGIRVAVKEGHLEAKKVQINFFHKLGASIIDVPQIDKNGHIDQWPEDFFDEVDKQLSNLL
ncbi:MAG: DUF3696 domain-containing protein [Desulfovibrionaceae bacterium]|nr:DUF3696 domain-containing protein [Desulfovibrionaceae bacterium]